MAIKFTLSFTESEEDLYLYLKSKRRPSNFLKRILEEMVENDPNYVGCSSDFKTNIPNIPKKVKKTEENMPKNDDMSNKTVEEVLRGDSSTANKTIEVENERVLEANLEGQFFPNFENDEEIEEKLENDEIEEAEITEEDDLLGGIVF